MSSKHGGSQLPKKLVILSGEVPNCAVVTDSMRILITRAPSSDPLFDGVNVQVETFIPNGTTDKVFYPYRKPATHNRPRISDAHDPEFFSDETTHTKGTLFPGPTRYTVDELRARQKAGTVHPVIRAAVERDDMDAKLDEHERQHTMIANRKPYTPPETDDPEFQMYIGEWMKWAEQNPEHVAPTVVAAVKRTVRDQSKEFDGNMERINVPSPARSEWTCDNPDCDRSVPNGDGWYRETDRLCRQCAGNFDEEWRKE